MEGLDNIEELNCVREEVKELIEEELTRSILERYTDICNDFGKKTFENITLPRLFAHHRSKYNILGNKAYDALRKEAEEIINVASYCKPQEIDTFLKKCVEAVEDTSKEHVRLEFHRRYRGQSITRSELKRIDREMYELLRKFGLMEESIPKYTRTKIK